MRRRSSGRPRRQRPALAHHLWARHNSPVSELAQRLEKGLAGRYTVERVLGEGGMAVVFLANDLRHDRKVALKVLRPELGSEIGADRFLRSGKSS